MSSTWFRKVKALKTKMPMFANSENLYDYYVLIAETAESNLTNYDGGHDYNEHIIAVGEDSQIIRKICSIAPSFDTGSCKWKPNHKDSCGFIRMCKKALEEATETDTIPSYIKGYIFWNMGKRNDIIEMFKDKENISKITMYGEDVLVSQDMKTYIKTKLKIEKMLEDYKEHLYNNANITFEDFYNEHKDWYKNY